MTPQLLKKLQTARQLRAVVVSSPTAVKSFMLKFIEICHSLNRQQYIMEEIKAVETHKIEKEKKKFNLGLKRMFGFGRKNKFTEGLLSLEEIQSLKEQSGISEDIFSIFNTSVEIMDEVDILLHPLKSELNWPLGE